MLHSCPFALIWFAFQGKQKYRKEQCFNPRVAPKQRPATARRFYQIPPLAGSRVGPRSAPLERLVVRTKATWGALWPAQQSRAPRAL